MSKDGDRELQAAIEWLESSVANPERVTIQRVNDPSQILVCAQFVLENEYGIDPDNGLKVIDFLAILRDPVNALAAAA